MLKLMVADPMPELLTNVWLCLQIPPAYQEQFGLKLISEFNIKIIVITYLALHFKIQMFIIAPWMNKDF